jgi:hypothetical protein
LPVESFPGAKRLTKKQCEIVEQLQIDGGEGVVYRWGFWSGCQVQTPSGSWMDAADVLERAILERARCDAVAEWDEPYNQRWGFWSGCLIEGSPAR